MRPASLTIDAVQEHETRIEERGAECREQLGAPASQAWGPSPATSTHTLSPNTKVCLVNSQQDRECIAAAWPRSSRALANWSVKFNVLPPQTLKP